MKVLFLTNVPSPYRVDFFNEIGKMVDLTVLFERQNAKCRNNEWISDNFKNFKYEFLKGIKVGDDGSYSPSVKKYLKQDFDIILLGTYHTLTSIIAANYCIKKNIQYGLSIDGIFKHDVENKFKLKLKRKMFSNASFFVTSGSYSVDVIEYYGGKRDKCHIYPFTSIKKDYILKKPLSNVEKNNLKKELGLSDRKHILYVGQFIERKGIDILLKAFKKLSNCELIMVGGELNDEYLKLKSELGIDFKTIKFLKSDELAKYYKASDVFVLPTREDQWGLVVNEALANGLPVISTNRCLSCFELIKDNGVIVNVDDIDSLAKEIKNILMMSDSEYFECQKNALNVIEDYTIENMALSHYEFFKKYLNKE